ncbi:hypothetical protein E1H99_08075 [Enterococcus hirae]|nr:hypothetical protein E1H99_08075 [Enterococcus hirae]
MSAQTMFLEIRHWEKSKDAETVRTKKKKIADAILEASGLPARELTDPEVVAIILQWQNNNLFKSYKFKEIAPMRTETTVSLNENQSNVTIELPLETNSVKDQVEMASFSTTPSSSTSVKLSADALKINSIITAFFAGKSSPVPLSEKLPLFMDDAEVYKKRNETDHVNDKVKEFLCTQKEPCDGLSPLQLINALYWWVWKEGEEKKIARSKEVAEVILSSSGLAGQEVSDDRASTIIQQWRNNNIFKGYQFKEPKQIHTETTASVNETQSSPTTELPIEANSVVYQVDEVLPPTRPSTISEKPLEDIKKINSMITAFFEEKPSSVPISEKLPLFLYDEALYKKRNETQSMNDDVKKFLCEQKVTCEKLSSPQLIIATEEWVRKGKNKGKVARSKQVAEVIFNSSGIVGQEISDDRAATILLQWRENNIFQGYQFKYLMKRHNEPTTDGHQVITVVLNENQPNTTTHASQLKKGNGFNLPHSNITTGLPIDKRSDKSSTPKFQSPNTYNKRYLEFTEKINSIITAFLEGKPSPVPTTEIFPTCYHEGAYAVYQQRHETSKVNEAIKKFLCNQKIPCEGLSLLQLITATQGWIRKEGKEIEKTRSKEIAELILTSSGLASQKLSGFQANAIFLQWRNNNIFKDYKFHEPSSDARMIKNNEPVGMITYTNLYTYGVLSLEGAAMVNKFHMAYLNEHPLTLPTYEPILPFWYDFALFQKRNETAKANEAVILFLVKQQEFSEGLPSKPTAIIAHEWVHEKQTDAEILARQKQLALIILEGYGIRRNLTATEAVNTVLQWENNNVFKDYTFVELKQSALSEKQFRNEPLTENSKMGVVPDTIKDPDLEFVHEIVEDITNNITPTTRYSEPLPIFYYHLLLFQKRNETSAVNKKMQEFFTKEGIAVKESSSSELEKTTLQWLETGSTHDVSDKYERKQFLAYFLLKAYGVEDLRLGEFLSSTKVQAIFNQWKANTLLEGYTYQEITYTTIHHQLSKEEDPSVIRLNEQKKESHQIFADFIYDRTATISKNQSIQTIYYHRTLFEKREKTLAVNEAVRKFLLEQKVSLKNQSASELVRRMQGWIFEGPTYGTILKREEQVAQLLQKEYGLEEEERTVKEPRYLLLQWGNNNAQVGYSYKDTSTFEAIEISAIEANEEEKERIEAFTRENKVLSPTEDTSLGMEEKLPEWTEEQQENIRKKVITFLEARNIKMDASKPNELIIKIARWVTKEVEGKETTDFTKVKMLANIILGKKEEAVILEEKAQAILIKWLLDNIEEEAPTFTSTELTNQTIKTIETTSVQPSVSRKQIPKYEAPNWRDKNMMIQIAQFFRQEGVLKGESTIENILIAMGKWFTESGSGMSLSQGKLQTLSKVILKELNLYGGEGKEKISDKDTRLTIMKWVAENVLGSSIEGYMIKQILDSPNPSQFTIGHLRKLFEVEELRKGGYITLHTLRNVSKEEEEIVKKLWFLLLKDTLPNYFLETSTLADELPVSNYDSLMQLTGAKLLADLGIQTQFNQAEIQMLGTFIWDKISKNGIKRVEELRYTVLPALLAIAQLDPDLLREALEKGTYYEVALSTFIEYHQNGYLQLKEHHDTLSALFTAYQKEVLNWRRKQALAKEVVQTYLQHAKGQLVYKAFVLEQDYLLGKSLSINDYTSPDLGEWYKRLTKAVSDSFYPLDQKLIEFALAAFDPEEREFIFSPETELYEASAVFENTEFLPDTLMGDPIPIILKTTSKLEQTDLFVAVQGDEKRWYALKKLEREGGYIFYRVDKNSMDYLKYGLMDHKDIWSQGYKREGNAIRVGKRLFMFVPTIDQSKKLSQGEDMQPLIDAFSRKHSDKLYDDLYQSGDDKAILEQIWDVAKHIIPFYDCVTASIDKDVAVAVPSCTIDIVLLIPVFGQMTSLSSKFAFGMAKAMAKGGIRNAIRQGPRFTPKLSEIKSVLINIRRYLDPGIESITDGSRFVIRELVDLKNEVWVKKNVKQLLGKIDGLVKKTPTLPKDVIRTYLPGKGLEVPVKRMKDKSYLLVTNLETGDVYGRPFLLRGNRLEIFSGPVSFTEEQKALINRLASGIDPDQVFVVEPNLNSNAYGSGEVMSVLEAGKETRYFITLNGQKVPVRVTSIEEHGVRYDVVDGEKIYPVNYNGKEWYFEPATSPFISKEMADEVMKKMDEFESIEDPSTLSAPDEKELMWNRMGRSYIKINDHYIPLIELYEGGSHYNLVQKDVLRPMTVLVFDPENEQFRFETDLEKKRWEKSIKSILWGADALNLRDTEFPPANKIPNSAGRSEEWNKFREAEKYENKGSRVEDDSIPFQQLAQFMPEAKALVHNGLEWHTKNILNDILEILPEKPKLDFWVYIGLEPNNVPDYIKLFQEDLAKEYAKAQNYYETVEGICQNLLIRPSIAETKEGQYLAKMFKLEGLQNKEHILREAVQRLSSVTKKGARFLQKTAEWGFENIWIVSTKLIQKGPKKYFSSYNEVLSTQAYIPDLDPECRIIFFADAFHANPDLAPDENVIISKSETTIHETTHVVSATTDLLRYSKLPKGFTVKSGKMLMEEYNKKKQRIFKKEGFEQFVEQLAEYQNTPTLSRNTVWNALDTDHVLRVNLQMTDAEILMVIIRDFAEERDFEGIVRVARSLNDQQLGNGFRFLLSSLTYMNNYDYFEKDSELNKTQEQITDISDGTSATTEGSDRLTNEKKVKREIASTTKGFTKNIYQSFSNLVTMSIERSTSTQSNPKPIYDRKTNKYQKELSLQH